MLTLLPLLVSCASAAKQWSATFATENSGVSGTVVVDNGKVTVDLDLTDVNDAALPGGSWMACITPEGGTQGLDWHIHEDWTYENATDTIQCGPVYTGGHIDPWNACGSASGNDYCQTSNNDFNYSCIDPADYSPDFENNPFSAEVGDWTAKYDVLVPDGERRVTGSFESFWEVVPTDLTGLSVVFHCADNNQRAFCAPFVESTESLSSTIPDQGSDQTVVAHFEALSADSEIMMHSTGKVDIRLYAKDVYDDLDEDDQCSEYEYTVWNAKSGSSLSESLTGSACADKVDGQYDPTHACLPWSDSMYCEDRQLCGDPEYDYECNGYDSSDRYLCAPGDLSGKFGRLNPSEELLENIEERSTLLLPTTSMVGKVIGIHCPYDGSEDPVFLACAEITVLTPTTTRDDSGASTISVLMHLCTVLVLMASVIIL